MRHPEEIASCKSSRLSGQLTSETICSCGGPCEQLQLPSSCRKGPFPIPASVGAVLLMFTSPLPGLSSQSRGRCFAVSTFSCSCPTLFWGYWRARSRKYVWLMKGMQRICSVLPLLPRVILEMAELILPEHPSSHWASAAILNCFIFILGELLMYFLYLITFVWLHLYHVFDQTNFACNLIYSYIEESNCLFWWISQINDFSETGWKKNINSICRWS